jgi:protein-S-isoprenylcysteine O-methyltransferase Ste14
MNSYLRLFGSGPIGVLCTLGLTGFFDWYQGNHSSRPIGLPISIRYLVLAVGAIGMLGGIVWSLRSLPAAERGRALCTGGAYRWVRHPLYASFITVGAPGLTIFLDDWLGLLWLGALHLIWHLVITLEERVMIAEFGAEYLAYAKHTGRFVPRPFKLHNRA